MKTYIDNMYKDMLSKFNKHLKMVDSENNFDENTTEKGVKKHCKWWILCSFIAIIVALAIFLGFYLHFDSESSRTECLSKIEISELINNDSDDIIYGNGLNFGESFDDDFAYLRPIVRCCSIGDSNLQTLLKYYNGRKLIAEMLKDTPKSPDPFDLLLWETHSTRMKRRIERILQKLRNCITNSPTENSVEHLTKLIDNTNLTNVFHVRNAKNITNITIVANVTVVTKNETGNKNAATLSPPPVAENKKSSFFPFSIFDDVADFFKNIFGPPIPLKPLPPLPLLPVLRPMPSFSNHDDFPELPELQIESPLKMVSERELPTISKSTEDLKPHTHNSKEKSSEVPTIPSAEDLL